MSIITAVTKRGKTVIAADTLYLTGSHKDYTPDLVGRSKVRKVGSSYIGITGWSLYQNIFDHYLAKARVPALRDEKVIFDFFMKLWTNLRERYSMVKDQREGADSPFGDLDSSFLIVNRYGIFDVHGNMTVWRHKHYCAIGCGAPYAYGALHATYDDSSNARELAGRAVAAAVRFDDGCGGDTEFFTV
jgi:ATP-dependent HslUV protease, peptidase subunit HslV